MKKKSLQKDDWIGNLSKSLKKDRERRNRDNDAFWQNIVKGSVQLACPNGKYIHVEKPAMDRHVICILTKKKCVCTSYSYNSEGPMFNEDWENCPGLIKNANI